MCMKKFFETVLSPFQARYGKEIPDNTHPTNSFVEGIIQRRTVRRFDTTKPIHPKLLEKLICAAQSAPTSSMMQTWSVISIRTEEGKSKFFKEEWAGWMGSAKIEIGPNKGEAPPSDPGNIVAIKECDTFLIWMVDHTIMDEVVRNPKTYEDNPSLKIYRDRVTESIRGFDVETRSITDAIIAAQTFALAAESMGLGVLYMGSLRNLNLWDDFRIPPRAGVLFGMCIGYPADSLDEWGLKANNNNPNKPVYTKPRLPQELVWHKEMYFDTGKEYTRSWENKEEPFSPERWAKVKEYNDLMKDFYNKNGDWFDRVVVRAYRNRNKHGWVMTFSGFFHAIKNLLD